MHILISSVNYAIDNLILYNSEVTQSWVTLYKKRRTKWDTDRKEFRPLNGRSVPYPDHLKENMPMKFPNSSVSYQVKEKYGASSRYPCVEEDALNIGIGCSNSVIMSFYTFLTS